ncbi:penicillin-binding protein activator [Candidatus Falkowbacteria bacterium]|nr:penicillin-binding protein activator [Candidatus Falkowbacteria bacterium]
MEEPNPNSPQTGEPDQRSAEEQTHPEKSNASRPIFWLVIVLLVIAGIWYSVAKKEGEEDTIKIGAVLPLTGNAAVWGERSRKGIDIAVKEINSAGGINSRELEIIYEDNLSQAAESVKVLQKLINVDKIKIIIGSVNSPETLAMAPVAEENKVIIIAPGSSSPKVTTAGDYIFRTRVSAEVESLELADKIINTLKLNDIALLYRDDDYGHGVGEAVKQHFENFGGTVKQVEVFLPGATDFKTSLTKIKAKEPEVILIAAEPKEVGLIMKQREELGIDTPVLIHSGSKGPEINELAKDAANGLIVLNTFDKTSKKTSDFIEKYNIEYGEEAEFVSALAYDATKILADMIQRCEIDNECIKDNLYQTKDYQGASSVLTFDENGDVIQPFIMEVFKSGQFVPYED